MPNNEIKRAKNSTIWDRINSLASEYSKIRDLSSTDEAAKINKKNEIISMLYSEPIIKFYTRKYSASLLAFGDIYQAKENISDLIIDTFYATIDKYKEDYFTDEISASFAGFAKKCNDGLYLKKCKKTNDGRYFFVIQKDCAENYKNIISEIKGKMKKINAEVYAEPAYYKNEDKYVKELALDILEETKNSDSSFKKGYIMAVKSPNSSFNFYIITEPSDDEIKLNSEFEANINKKISTDIFPVFFSVKDENVISIGFTTKLKLKDKIEVKSKYRTQFDFKLSRLFANLTKNKVNTPGSTDVSIIDNNGEETEIGKNFSNEDIVTEPFSEETDGSEGGLMLLLIMNSLEVYKRTSENSGYKDKKLCKLDVYKKIFAETTANFFTLLGNTEDKYNPIDNYISKFEKNIFDSIDVYFLDYFMDGKYRTFNELMYGEIKNKELKIPCFSDSVSYKFPLNTRIYSNYYINLETLKTDKANEQEKAIRKSAFESERVKKAAGLIKIDELNLSKNFAHCTTDELIAVISALYNYYGEYIPRRKQEYKELFGDSILKNEFISDKTKKFIIDKQRNKRYL